MKRVLLGFLVVAALALVTVFFGYRTWLRSWLESDGFRHRVEVELAELLGAKAQLAAIRVPSPDSLYTDRFHASGSPLVELLLAEQVRADVRLALLSRSATVEHAEVARVRLRLGAGRPRAGKPASEVHGPVELRGDIRIHRLDLAWPGGALERVALKVAPASKEWLLSAEGGLLQPGSAPAWDVQKATARYRDGALHLTDAHLRQGPTGEATLSGKFEGGALPEVVASFKGVPVEEYLPQDWRARLSGQVEGRATWKAEGRQRVLEGVGHLTGGTLAALPMLEHVALVTQMDAYRKLPLHLATASVRQVGERVEIRDLLVESNGLLKVEGALLTIAKGQISGEVQLGVPAAALRLLPGAKTKVFTTERGGYLWATVRLSGSAFHPQEDLSSRLAAAAVTESAGAVRDGVLEGARGVLDVVTPMIPKGLLPY